MIASRRMACRTVAAAGLMVLLASAAASPARAQGHTPDPYNPYNAQYDSFVYPTYPNPEGYVPNQGLLDGRTGVSGSNRFQEYIEGGEGDLGEDFGRRRGRPGTPYYQAYRRLDRDYDRVYRPNQSSDSAFYQDQQSRNDLYVQYLREKDPKKRAQRYREYMQESRKASRDLAAPRSSIGRPQPATGSSLPAAPEPPSGIGGRGGSLSRSPLTGGSRPSTLLSDPGRRGSLTAPRSSSSAAKPSEILRRSEEMNRQRRPGATGSSRSPSSTTNRRPSSLLPPP